MICQELYLQLNRLSCVGVKGNHKVSLIEFEIRGNMYMVCRVELLYFVQVFTISYVEIYGHG